MSTRQNKKRKGRSTVNTRERTVTTLTEDPNTPFLVPTLTEEPAGTAMPSTPFSATTPLSSSGPNANNMSPQQPFGGASANAAIHSSPVVLPPGKNDLEVLENLKQIIKNGQHEIYKAVPKPAALASIYLGPKSHQHQQPMPTGSSNTENPMDYQNATGNGSSASFPPSPYDTANISSSNPLPSPIPAIDNQGRRPPRMQNKESWDRDRGSSALTAPSPINTSSGQSLNVQNQNSRGSFGSTNSNVKISSSFSGVKSGSDLRSPLDAKVLAPAPSPSLERSRYDGNGSHLSIPSSSSSSGIPPFSANDGPRTPSWAGSRPVGEDNTRNEHGNRNSMPPPPLPSESSTSNNAISSLPNRPPADLHHRDGTNNILSRSASGSYNESNGRYDRDHHDPRDRDGPRDARDGPRDARDGPRDARDGPRDARDGLRDARDGPRDPRDGPRDSRDDSYRDSRDIVMRDSRPIPAISPRDVDRSRPDFRFRERNEQRERELRLERERERELRERETRDRDIRGRPTSDQRHYEPSYGGRREDTVRSADDRSSSNAAPATSSSMDVDRRPIVIKSEEGPSRPLNTTQPPSAPLEERLGLRTSAQQPTSTVPLQDRISGPGTPASGGASLEDRLSSAPSVPTGPAALSSSIPTAPRPAPRNGLPPNPVTANEEKRYTNVTPPHDRGLPRAPAAYAPTQPRSASAARDLPPKSSVPPPLSPQRNEYRPPANIPPRPNVYRPDDNRQYDDRDRDRRSDHMDVDRPAYPARRYSPPSYSGASSASSALPVRPPAEAPYEPDRGRNWNYSQYNGTRNSVSSAPRDWTPAEEDAYRYERDRLDRDRYDRDRFNDREAPPSVGRGGWETREDRASRASFDGGRGPAGPAAPISSYPPDDRGRPYSSSVAPVAAPARSYPPARPISPPYPNSNNRRPRSPTPPGRRPAEDMRPPPMKRPRDDLAPYAPSSSSSVGNSSGYYASPQRRPSTDYPPVRGNTPPPGGSGYYPPADYPPSRDGYAAPLPPGAYSDRDRRPPSPPRAQYSRPPYASSAPSRPVDPRDDRRYLGPRP